ncbi:MAG: hypothetical protein LR015_10645 [Verrucomicrobia bacterium]|nr:hypothetical protein [Verrucomicrobiota bacterium]
MSISEGEDLDQQLERLRAWPVLKIKVGGTEDARRILKIRQRSQQRIWVDANESWTDYQQARQTLFTLADAGVEWVEQPVPAAAVELQHKLHRVSPIPLMADESCHTLEDLPGICRHFSAINMKLMKAGSMTEGLKIIRAAHQLGLKSMVGCMIESSLGITAAGLIAQEADMADLDGHLWLQDDPWEGLQFAEEGIWILPDEAGLGVKPRAATDEGAK